MVGAMKFSLVGALAVVALASASASASATDDPVGFWATEKHESQIKIEHCGGTPICGYIFWMRDPYDSKGVLKTDKKNEDDVKKKHPLQGLKLISMEPDDDHWKGTVYNPENGKIYSATLKMLSKNEVQLEGCVAYILCGSQKWTREEPRVPASTAMTHTAPKTGSETPTPNE